MCTPPTGPNAGGNPDPRVHPCPDKAFEYAANQLDREIQLTRNRLGWFLTFSGLLIASIALAARAPAGDSIRETLLVAAPLAGLAAALFTFIGLRASEAVRDDIKTYWAVQGQRCYPPIHSGPQGSQFGRLAAKSIPLTMAGVWISILLLARASH